MTSLDNYYPNWVFSMFAFAGFLMCCIPFPWHFEAWNTGTCLYMAWTGLGCLNLFINSIVWNGHAKNLAPVWCDISAKLIVGVAVAIPAASLCINRRLYHIATVRSVTITRAEKRRAVMVDLAIGLGLPIMEMILQYIPQGHRFNIFGDVGCYPFTYSTPVALALVSVPPVLIGMVSACYAVLSIRAFAKSRSQFNEYLSHNNHSNLNSSRYVRLMCLASVDILCVVPLAIYAIYVNVSSGNISPWKGWADTHAGFSRVDQTPAFIWHSIPGAVNSLEMSRWLTVACAFIFFAFFGFADEAMKNYRSYVQTVSKKVGLSTGSTSEGSFSVTGSKSKGFTSSTSGNGPTLPVFVHKEYLRKHDSMDSFSDMTTSFADVGGALDEKSFDPAQSYGRQSMSDVGATLADFQSMPYSPTPSSGSSSASSISSPVDSEPPSFPEAVVTVARPESGIEISSVRHLSVTYPTITVSVPEPSHTPRSHQNASDNV